MRDEALEAWILAATRSVSDQLASGDLVQKDERLGVPVTVIDWKDHELALLGAGAGDLARARTQFPLPGAG